MKKVLLMMTAFCVMLSMFTRCGNSDPLKGYDTTASGLKVLFHENNGGDCPNIGDLVDVTLACYVNDSTTIIPASDNIIQLSEPMFATDFMEGVAMMHKGDFASFVVNIDSAFYYLFRVPELPAQFKSTDILRFDVKVNDFYPESEYMNKMNEKGEKAKAVLKKYIEDNNILVEPTESGLYYVKINDGNGEKPAQGDNVKVHYTGKLLNGTVFDSSVERGEPIEVPIGMGYVIPGWDEGIMMMSKGEKGILYIPYDLAYGPTGASPVIPPFANLIFEVELIDF